MVLQRRKGASPPGAGLRLAKGWLCSSTRAGGSKLLRQHVMVMPAVKGTEAATAALYSHRYRAFRDRDSNLTLTYWQLLAVRLGFVIVFEAPAAGPGLSAGAGGEDLPPRPTCTSPLTSSTWFSLLDV